MESVHAFGLAFVAIFAALDIIGTLPLYVSMTQSMGRDERYSVTDKSMLVAFIVAVVFTFIGEWVFKHLGIELFDFRIAGGIVLLLIALADLLGRSEAHSRGSGSTGIVPIAVPLITGPAVLATLVLQAHSVGYGVTIAALLLNYSLAWALLRRSDLVTRIIGQDGTMVISKIAALLLAAISVAMIRSGVFDAVAAFRAG